MFKCRLDILVLEVAAVELEVYLALVVTVVVEAQVLIMTQLVLVRKAILQPLEWGVLLVTRVQLQHIILATQEELGPVMAVEAEAEAEALITKPLALAAPGLLE